MKMTGECVDDRLEWVGRIGRWSAAILAAAVLSGGPVALVEAADSDPAAVAGQDEEPSDTVEPPDTEPTTPDTEPTEEGDQEPAEPADVPVIAWIGAGIVVAAALGFAVRGVRRD